MKTKILPLLLIALTTCCNENSNFNNSVNKNKLTQIEAKIKDTHSDIKAKVALTQKVISLKQIKDFFKLSNSDYTHHKITDNANLNVDMANIPVFSGYNMLHAFSYKGYPRTIKPKRYNHFVLYVYEYPDSVKANVIFEELKKIVNTGRLNGNDEENAIKVLSNAAYFGGFICLKNNFIIWRVETCTPDYQKTDPVNEYNFLKFLYSDEELATIKFLNSDCGDMFRTYSYLTFVKAYSYALKQKLMNK
ncbi:MAG: hypothetical protein K9I36_16055 [Bacteroidia bacterium]|nr:hypothetical protein [Bacteroidia bacterium]